MRLPPLLEVILLALTLLTGLVWYAATPDDWRVGDFVLRKPPFAEWFAPPPPPLDTTPLPPPPPKDTVAVVDTSAQRILLLGDSMAWELIRALEPACQKGGHTLHGVTIVSATTKKIARSDTLARLIEAFDPTLVVLVLGSNELLYPYPKTQLPFIESLAAQADGRRLVWIGPPNWKEDTGLNDLIAGVVGPDCFFRSKGLHFKRQADGVHPTYRASVAWADTITRWLDQTSRFRIRLTADTTLLPEPVHRLHPGLILADEPIREAEAQGGEEKQVETP